MARPKIPRFVEGAPAVTYFKPRGVPARELDEVRISVEELEAVRLVDIEGMSQEEAAERMEISRSTMQRTLVGARRKIAEALVYGKAVGIRGGRYVECPPGAGGVFQCVSCGHEWKEPFGTGTRARDSECVKCGSRTVVRGAGGGGGGRRRGWGK